LNDEKPSKENLSLLDLQNTQNLSAQNLNDETAFGEVTVDD
jgi:hypothetical protein